MKTVAILFFVVLVAAQAQAGFNVVELAKTAAEQLSVKSDLSMAQRAVTAAARTRCRKTETMTQEEEDKIRANNFTDLTHKQQCFIKCVSDSFTFANIALELVDADTSVIKKVLEPISGQVVPECEQLKGADACETSALKYKCLVDAGKINLI